jgi:hypothetical protein
MIEDKSKHVMIVCILVQDIQDTKQVLMQVLNLKVYNTTILINTKIINFTSIDKISINTYLIK